MEKGAPTVVDFPPLDAWLRKHNAKWLWCADTHHATVQTWEINGRIFLILLYTVAPAWDIFTSHDGNGVYESLLDADRRLGIA